MRFVIVASGPSAKNFTPPDDVTVIAVNGAIDWLARADIFFTLDPSPENIQRIANKREGVEYFCALPVDCPQSIDANIVERFAARGEEPTKKRSPQWWLWRWSAVLGLSETPGVINTGNSVYGALGLAYHIGAEKVALVGVDANSNERIDGGVPNNLSHLPLLFESAMDQINFINCGDMKSKVPQYSIEEGMQWLMS